jgi:hypothetical protein
LSELQSRKKEILDKIRDLRQQGGQNELSQFRQEIIQQIKNELTKNPPVENEELNEPN